MLKRTALSLLLLMIAISAFAQKRDANIVFIGNSITYGAGLADPAHEAPPVKAAEYLRQQPGIGTVTISNQGHSGYTTLDFLPGTDAFKGVEHAAQAFADKNAQLIFSIKLGTNDSAVKGPHGSPVSIDDYRKNVKAIVDSLLKEFPKCMVVINHPVWYSPNTYNGAVYLQEGLNRLKSYIPIIDVLVAEYKSAHQNVFLGDTKAFDYFKNNYLTDLQPEDGHQGTFYLHPNAKGAKALGEFWAKAIARSLKKVK